MLCKFCGVLGIESDFYISNKNKCKACICAAVIKNRTEKIEYYRAFDKLRASQPHRVQARKEYMKTPEGKAAHTRALKKQVLLKPMHAIARNAVSNAVRDGRLFKTPCVVCGNEKVEGHHPDYDKPLDVVWLCMMHHKQVHGLMKTFQAAA